MHAALAVIGVGPFDINWLGSTLVLTTPLLLAAIGELISERAGVLNVGLEGFMLVGAFFAYLIVWKSHSLAAGVAAAVAVGIVFAAIMGVLAIEAGADQVVAGVGINLAALGLTSYLFDQIFGNLPQIVVPTVGSLRIPVLASIPQFGRVLFDNDWTLYLAFLLVPIAWFLLFRTKWGLAIRSAGELPIATDTAGISVRRIRWMSLLTAGGLAGLAGANLAVVQVGVFEQDMTAGRGFLALVAVIFGRWTPLGTLGACLALGGADALQLRLADESTVPTQVWGLVAVIAAAMAVYAFSRRRRRQKRGRAAGISTFFLAAAIALTVIGPHLNLPNQFWIALPYLVALGVLSAAITRGRMPSKLTQPYSRGEG